MVRGETVTRSSDIVDLCPKLDDEAPDGEPVETTAADRELMDDCFSASSSEFEFKMEAPNEEDQPMGEIIR